MSYPIEVNLIPGLPQEPYDGGAGNYIGVIGHATAIYGDTPDSERNVEVTGWSNAFVHFFVGVGKILQVADTSFVAYGAGHTANHLGYAQVELCQTNDSAHFTQDYAMYTWLLAKLLHDRKLCVVDGVTLMSHSEVSNKWHETDHDDPIEYLASHNKTWADVVADVTKQYNEMEDDFEMEHAIVYFSAKDYSVAEIVAERLGGCGMFCRNANNALIHADAKAAKHLVVIGGAPVTDHPNVTNCCGAAAPDTAILAAQYAKTL